MRRALLALGLAAVVGQSGLAEEKPAASTPEEAAGGLKYHDGTTDGKKSMGGAGPLITFGAPAGAKIAAIKVHASRYGQPKAPDESVLVYVLSGDQKRVLHTEIVPYSAFERGNESWVTVKFGEPVEVPSRFWIAIDPRAHQTKGIYFSYDTSTGGKNSRAGLPGMKVSEVKDRGDWMIEAVPAS